MSFLSTPTARQANQQTLISALRIWPFPNSFQSHEYFKTNIACGSFNLIFFLLFLNFSAIHIPLLHDFRLFSTTTSCFIITAFIVLQKWALSVNIWKFTAGFWQGDPESSQFLQEFRLCLFYSYPSKQILLWVWPAEVPAGGSAQLSTQGSMSCWLPAWAGISSPTSAQVCAVAVHKCTNICHGLGQSQASASSSHRGAKAFSCCTREQAREEKLVLWTSVNQFLKLRLCSSDD